MDQQVEIKAAGISIYLDNGPAGDQQQVSSAAFCFFQNRQNPLGETILKSAVKVSHIQQQRPLHSPLTTSISHSHVIGIQRYPL